MPVIDLDLRLFEDDLKTVLTDIVTDLNHRLVRGVGVILSVGLSRRYAKSGDVEERYWLQVNGIHPQDNPPVAGPARPCHSVRRPG